MTGWAGTAGGQLLEHWRDGGESRGGNPWGSADPGERPAPEARNQAVPRNGIFI